MRCCSRLAVCGLLLIAVGLVFAQSAGFRFVFDDGGYIVDNRGLFHGVTWESIRWAFTSSHMATGIR